MSTPSERTTGLTPSIGHNRTAEERKAEFVAAITKYVIEVREVEAMSLRDLALLSDKQRIGALQNAHLISTIRLCRANDRMDSTLAVRDLIYAMADMQQRCCLLSAGQIGKVLNRNERNIRNALDKLVDDKVIGRIEKPGRYNAHYPILDKRLALEPASPDWIIQAFVPGALRGGRVDDDFSVEDQLDSYVGREHPTYPGRKHPTSKTDPGRTYPGCDTNPGREHPTYPADPGRERPASEPQVVFHPGRLRPIETRSIVLDSRDSPLTPEQGERGVWGESKFNSDPTPSPSAPSKKEPHTTEQGAQKAKRAPEELVLKPIEVVEAEVLNPGEGFGAGGALRNQGPGAAPPSERKKPLRSFPKSEDEVKRLWAYCIKYGMSHGMTEDIAKAEARHWKDWAESKGRQFSSWDAAWRTWVSNWSKRKYQPASSGYAPSRSRTIEDAMDAAFGKLGDDK
jgi:hypothetical protein